MAQGATDRFVTLERAATLTCSMLNSVREWHGDSAYRVHSLQGIGPGENRRSGCGWRVV
jgi:hypothetical protein